MSASDRCECWWLSSARIPRADSNAGVDLDLQALAIEVVGDIEGAEATARPQRVGHEVGRRGIVHDRGDLQRVLDAVRQPRFLPRLGRLSLRPV